MSLFLGNAYWKNLVIESHGACNFLLSGLKKNCVRENNKVNGPNINNW